MAFHWCEYFGGLLSSKCNSWTPSGVNTSETKPMSDYTIGETPIAQVTSSMLPITWQITSNLKLILDNHNDNMRYTFYDANNNIIYQDEDWLGTDYNRYIIGFCVDDARQQGAFMLGQYRRGSTSVTCYARPPLSSTAQRLYSYFSEAEQPPVLYNWQSVSSISGKNGILQPLSTLVNINDGNPVSGASASAVNIIPASVVSEMIQTGASDVIVSFEIPQLTSGTYDSIKLVGKRGGIPRSKTDGEFIETLSDSDTSKTLTGLTKGYTYWFVIFAEDSKGSSSESDPYPYETGEGESIAFFEIDLGQGGKDIVRYDASKSIGSHKQGELYGNYSIANDELSTNGYIYWDYDATENPKSIPADCCLYFEYDTLFTGQEGYLDWYVIDSNNAQQIYWCYDTKYAFQSDKWYNCLVVAEVKNGYIKRYKYVLDGIEIEHDTANIKMPCTDTEGSIGISEIYFHTTQPTKIKNMSIYYDFSTYTDAGGGGGGGSGASGSNPVS